VKVKIIICKYQSASFLSSINITAKIWCTLLMARIWIYEKLSHRDLKVARARVCVASVIFYFTK